METVIHKAGGVLIHKVHGEPFVYMVHRSRYNDWSLPKGHIDAGETTQQAAARELQEETGMRGRLIMELPAYEYHMPNGDTSSVAMYVFAFEAVEGELDLSEVDHGKWVTVEEAIQLCSYPSLKEYLALVHHHIIAASAGLSNTTV